MRLLAAAGIALAVLGTGCGGSSSDGPPAEDQPAGKVVEVSGAVSAERPGATGAVERRSLAVGDLVAGIDVIVTAADAAVTIQLDHNGARWALDGGQRKQVSQSAAWRAPRQGSGEVLAGGTDDHTAAAGRHAEREAASTRATAGVQPEPESAPGAAAPPPVQAVPVAPAAPAPTAVPPPPPPSGGTGTRMSLEEGRMGKRDSASRPPAKPARPRASDDEIGLGTIGTVGRGGGAGYGTGAPGGGGGGGGGSSDKKSGDSMPPPAPDAVHGSLSPEVIRKVMSARRAAFKQCWETSGQPPDLKISLKVDVGTDGAVTGAQASGADGALAACLVQVVRGARFPSPGGAPFSFRYPLVFRAD